MKVHCTTKEAVNEAELKQLSGLDEAENITVQIQNTHCFSLRSKGVQEEIYRSERILSEARNSP